MPDKEFDKLFRDQFADAEIEPSVNLWAGIEQQLAPKAKQRKLPILWMAAASVAVVVSAMFVFQKKEKIMLRGADNFAVTQPVTIATEQEETVTVNQVVAQENKAVVRKAVYNKPAETATKNNNEIFVAALQPSNEIERLPIKQQEARPIEIAKVEAVVVDNPIVLASVDLPKNMEDNAISEVGTERKGIRNVGDLVNYVVDKVDKRDKKIIKFNTDDDDSSIIGINIGFLKLNSRKDK
ncbi:MAG: hypothetical protein EOO96_22460 [Pedobacter sp.]|nr:MAG: hypothetical protein EOO96_22460 [Pedobacter sp.]